MERVLPVDLAVPLFYSVVDLFGNSVYIIMRNQIQEQIGVEDSWETLLAWPVSDGRGDTYPRGETARKVETSRIVLTYPYLLAS